MKRPSLITHKIIYFINNIILKRVRGFVNEIMANELNRFNAFAYLNKGTICMLREEQPTFPAF